MVEKRTFKQAFNAVFHDEGQFEYFCSADFSHDIESITINGRTRFKTTDRLRKILRFVDSVVVSHLALYEDVVHSFVKGKNTLSAVEAHAGSKQFFLSDIKQFYTTIRPYDVRKVLKRGQSEIPISDLGEYIDRLVSLTTYGGSLPAGFSTSPALSNAFLYDFDMALAEFCKQQSLIYTRYADDLIVSGGADAKLGGMRDVVQDLLWRKSSEQLVLKKSKTRVTHLGNKVKILGLVITPDGKITIDSAHKNKIETALHFFVTDKVKYQSYLQEHFSNNEHSLFGILHYARSVDKSYMVKLQRKYGAYALSKMMENRWAAK